MGCPSPECVWSCIVTAAYAFKHNVKKRAWIVLLDMYFYVIEIVVHSVRIFLLLNLQVTCLNFQLGYNLFIASKQTCIHLIIICYVIILFF